MRRRGFTLIEMVVYMGLVTTGLIVCGGIELQAQRSVAVQGSLVDIDTQALDFLGKLRRDVEDGRTLTVRDGAELVVLRLDGSSVIYRTGTRIDLSAAGKERTRERYRLQTGFSASVSKAPSKVAVIATFKRGDVERTFHKVAAPRLEVTQ